MGGETGTGGIATEFGGAAGSVGSVGSAGSVGSTGGSSGSAGDLCPDCEEIDCDTNADCPQGQRCWRDVCQPIDEVPACIGVDGPVCGDGVIDALEACDGGPGCASCRDGEAVPSWSFPDQVRKVVPTPDGTELAVVLTPGEIGRYDLDGQQLWSVELEEHPASDLTVDADGNTYVVGRNYLFDYEAQAPWIASWDPAGVLRWSVDGASIGGYGPVDVGQDRVFVGGSTEQANSPGPRGLIAQHALDGTLEWSEKLPAFESVMDVLIVGDEAAVLGAGLDFPNRTLLRVDAGGQTLWSRDLTSGGWPSVANALRSDGEGGTWVFGEEEEGPLAIRHDAAGDEVERLECFANTAGTVTGLSVGPDGRIGIGVLVSPGPVPLEWSTPWLAIREGGTVTAGVVFDAEATLRMFELQWLPDGRLLVGLNETDPDVSHLFFLDP